MIGKKIRKSIRAIDSTYSYSLEEKMNKLASKLEFEDAAKLRDEINRLKAREVGIPKKIIGLKN